MIQNNQVKPLILVVDDNDEHRAILSQWLERSGYRVAQVADASAVEGTALRNAPDLILMDLSMPELDGFVCTRRLRARQALRDVPIIAVSALIREEIIGAALEAGCNEVVSKPFDYGTLESRISHLLHQKANSD
jgi:CheY-like chemotaxis protein